MGRSSFELCTVAPGVLEAYVAVPMRVRVRARVVPGDPPHRLPLRTEPVAEPYVKDYAEGSAMEQVAELRRFADGTLVHFAVRDGRHLVAGATVLHGSPSYDLLEGRTDLATLRDIRVHPDWQRRGLGRLLMQTVIMWARNEGLAELQIETQDVNVPACRLYETMGCVLRAVREGAYAAHPHELQLLWYRQLDDAPLEVREPRMR